MEKITKEVKIISVQRLNNSYYGNPAWRVIFEDEESNRYFGKTASNASCGYTIDTSSDGKKYTLTYHYTKADNLIIDYATEIESTEIENL